jgi:hypothetical protein
VRGGERVAVCTACMHATRHLTGKPAAVPPREPVDPCVPCPSQVFPGGYIAWRLLETSLDGTLPRVIPSMCRFWEEQGFCRNGDGCRFAHHPLEIEALRCRVRCGYGGLNLVIDWVHDEDRAIYLDDDDTTAEEEKRKREEPAAQPEGENKLPRSTGQRPTCMFWQKVGSCKWGAECRFEHAGGERGRNGVQSVSSNIPSKSA